MKREDRADGASSSYCRRFFRLQWSVAVKCLIVGIFAGFLVSFYRLAVEGGLGFAHAAYGVASRQPAVLCGLVVAAALAGLVVHRLVSWEPMASGSGIPQTEGVSALVLKMRWWSVLIVRYLGGILGSLFGLSLGREGPCVQIGAAAGQAVLDAEKKGGLEKSCLISAGAAAGLSAAFSAPLSGIVFALEEVHRSFSPFLLIAAAMGSLAAGAVVSVVFGLNPVLFFVHIEELAIPDYVWMLPLGVLCGALGSGMNRLLLASQTLYGKLPAWAAPVVSFLIAIPVGMLVPQAIGGGSGLIEFAETAQASLVVLIGLLVVKMLYTCTSFGSGTPGGIFMPTLATGALAGAAFCALLAQAGLVSTAAMAEFAVCGMAATFTGCVKTPVTGIVLTVEMSGSLAFLLPVALSAFTALFVSDLLRTNPIYNSLLDRYIDGHGKTDDHDDPDRVFEIFVREGSRLDGAEVSRVAWPGNSTLVSVHKAWRTVVPRQTTRIRHDDLLIFSPLGDRAKAKADLQEMATTTPPSNEGGVRPSQ